jgi:hypothetical protein
VPGGAFFERRRPVACAEGEPFTCFPGESRSSKDCDERGVSDMARLCTVGNADTVGEDNSCVNLSFYNDQLFVRTKVNLPVSVAHL